MVFHRHLHLYFPYLDCNWLTVAPYRIYWSATRLTGSAWWWNVLVASASTVWHRRYQCILARLFKWWRKYFERRNIVIADPQRGRCFRNTITLSNYRENESLRVGRRRRFRERVS